MSRTKSETIRRIEWLEIKRQATIDEKRNSKRLNKGLLARGIRMYDPPAKSKEQ